MVRVGPTNVLYIGATLYIVPFRNSVRVLHVCHWEN